MGAVWMGRFMTLVWGIYADAKAKVTCRPSQPLQVIYCRTRGDALLPAADGV